MGISITKARSVHPEEREAAACVQPQLQVHVHRPSALIVTMPTFSLAASGRRRRWTNGGRAGGQCLDSGAVFCLNSETVKAVCAGWRGHYPNRLQEVPRGGSTAAPEVGPHLRIVPLNQMTIGSQSSNALPPPSHPPTLPPMNWASSCFSNPLVAQNSNWNFFSHRKLKIVSRGFGFCPANRAS